MNEILLTMASHYTVREFRRTPVPDEHVREVVRAAQMASTSSWIQGYSLLQVTDAARRAKLRELTGGQAQVEEAGAFFVISADTRRHRLIAEREDAPYDANLETFLLVTVDATLFAQNLALGFESLGYGICFIGGLRNRLPEADDLLELPFGVLPLFGLCVGEPAHSVRERAERNVRPRLEPEAVWSKDRYPSDEEVLAALDRHDAIAAEHYIARGLEGRNWTGGTWRKFRARQREHLIEHYRSKGAIFE